MSRFLILESGQMTEAQWLFVWGTVVTLFNGLIIALWRVSWGKIDDILKILRTEIEGLKMSKADRDEVDARHKDNVKRLEEIVQANHRAEESRDKMWDALHNIQISVGILLDRSARTERIEDAAEKKR